MEKSCSALSLGSGRLPCGAATQLPAPDGTTCSNDFLHQFGFKLPQKQSYWILLGVLSKSRVLCHEEERAPDLETSLLLFLPGSNLGNLVPLETKWHQPLTLTSTW